MYDKVQCVCQTSNTILVVQTSGFSKNHIRQKLVALLKIGISDERELILIVAIPVLFVSALPWGSFNFLLLIFVLKPIPVCRIQIDEIINFIRFPDRLRKIEGVSWERLFQVFQIGFDHFLDLDVL